MLLIFLHQEVIYCMVGRLGGGTLPLFLLP
jgi:hypothetical protein